MLVIRSIIKNKLLTAMSDSDFAMLDAGLTPVDLPRGLNLMFAGEPIAHCYFLEDGIASMVAMTREGHEAEAAIIGIDGMADVSTILGQESSPLRCNIQIGGHGYRLPARVLTAAYDASPTLRLQLNSLAFAVLAQIAQTALVNASFSIEERLARWLLMCADRLVGDDIHMTHEFLALMLNVRRAGVTLAMQSLLGAGLLGTTRGVIRIVDRAGLEEFAHDAYDPAATESALRCAS